MCFHNMLNEHLLDTCSNVMWLCKQMHIQHELDPYGEVILSMPKKKMAKSVFSASTWMVSFHRILNIFCVFFFFSFQSPEIRNSNNHNIFILHSCETGHRCDLSQYPNNFLYRSFNSQASTHAVHSITMVDELIMSYSIYLTGIQ